MEEYDISFYPITNAQFEPFLTEGYANINLWSSLGRSWLLEQEQKAPRQPSGLPNYPCVGITWYEAVAYSNWLTLKMHELGLLDEDKAIELPTEPLWSKAARGPNGFLYSWGNDWAKLGGNVDEVNINEVCAVGLFQNGKSPYGAMDMTGNIWEWCRSSWRNYPYISYDGREDLNSPETKVVRGGSYSGGAHSCRCEYRGLGDPGYNSQNLGFRLVRVRKPLETFQSK